VVGCPRSGSRFFVKVLRNSGFQVAHESFRRDGTVGMFFAVEDYWYPGQHWTVDDDNPVEDESRQHRSDYEFEQVWHYVRDPRRVIPSMARYLAGTVWCWQERHTEISCGLYPKKLRAMKFWVTWNSLIEQNERVDLRFRMEDIDDYWKGMKGRLGIPADKVIPDAYPRDYGSNGQPHERPQPMTWDEMKSLDEPTYRAVREMAQRYGYED
jgi:hypothetical protein